MVIREKLTRCPQGGKGKNHPKGIITGGFYALGEDRPAILGKKKRETVFGHTSGKKSASVLKMSEN